MTCVIPEMDLDLARIQRATDAIDPVFLHSPQFVDDPLCDRLARDVVVKLETANPLHSFKGRGADFLMRQLDPTRTVVCATQGNFGQAIAYTGRTRGIEVEIFVDPRANPAKVDRMRALGGQVNVVDGPPGTTIRAAREHARRQPDRIFIEDGKEPAIAEGAGTIATELLGTEQFDAIVIPVGDGALINGMARWIKAHAPHVHVVGVCARGAPAMAHAWRGDDTQHAASAETIAETITPLMPHPDSIRRMRPLVDDMVLVDDTALLDAMRLAAETVGVLLEPAGAAGLAAIATHDLPGDRLATVLTGSNPRPDLLRTMFS
jgi:threonine dehydratase